MASIPNVEIDTPKVPELKDSNITMPVLIKAKSMEEFAENEHLRDSLKDEQKIKYFTFSCGNEFCNGRLWWGKC